MKTVPAGDVQSSCSRQLSSARKYFSAGIDLPLSAVGSSPIFPPSARSTKETIGCSVVLGVLQESVVHSG